MNSAPAVSVTTPTGTVNDVVAIEYRLTDQESDRVSVTVQFNQNPDAFESGPHVAMVNVDLLDAETRTVRIDDIIDAWKKEVGDLPEVINLTITEPVFGPAGRPKPGRARLLPVFLSANQRTVVGSTPLPVSQRSISARWPASFWLVVSLGDDGITDLECWRCSQYS